MTTLQPKGHIASVLPQDKKWLGTALLIILFISFHILTQRIVCRIPSSDQSGVKYFLKEIQRQCTLFATVPILRNDGFELYQWCVS